MVTVHGSYSSNVVNTTVYCKQWWVYRVVFHLRSHLDKFSVINEKTLEQKFFTPLIAREDFFFLNIQSYRNITFLHFLTHIEKFGFNELSLYWTEFLGPFRVRKNENPLYFQIMMHFLATFSFAMIVFRKQNSNVYIYRRRSKITVKILWT